MKPRIFAGVVAVTTLLTLTSPQLVLAQSASASASVQEQRSSEATPLFQALDSGLERFVAQPTQQAAPQFEGITIQEPTKAPSRFGLFFRGIKEQVSLITTINPVKKAEKQLQFAEERIKIAEKIIASSDSVASKEKAAQMIEKANSYMEKIADKQQSWLEKKDEQTDRLIKNIATHQIHREETLNRIEEKLPEEAIQKIEFRREEILEKNKRLFDAIQDADLPEEVREHIKEAKNSITIHAEEAKAFKEKNSDLLKQAAEGNEEAQRTLESLRVERRETAEEQVKRQQMIEQFMTKKSELEQKFQGGDETAKKQLEQMDAFQRQMETMQRDFQKDRPETFRGRPPFPPEGNIPMGQEDFFGDDSSEEGFFGRPEEGPMMDPAALERQQKFMEELRGKVLQGDQEAGNVLEQMGRGREGQAPFDPAMFGSQARPTFDQPFDKQDLEKRAGEGNGEAQGLLKKINREQDKLKDMSAEEAQRLRNADTEQMKKAGIQPGMPGNRPMMQGPAYAPKKVYQQSPEDIGYKPNTEFYRDQALSKEEVQGKQEEEMRKFNDVRDRTPVKQMQQQEIFTQPGFGQEAEKKFQPRDVEKSQQYQNSDIRPQPMNNERMNGSEQREERPPMNPSQPQMNQPAQPSFEAKPSFQAAPQPQPSFQSAPGPAPIQ